jgi:hypothetical protein
VKKTMRLFMVLLVGVFLCLAGSIVPAQAAPYYAVIDEYGPGYLKDKNPCLSCNPDWFTWNGALRADPTVPGATSLIYIGQTTISFSDYFDVLVYDPSGTVVSDDLRFYKPTDPGLVYVIFYSDGGGAPADTGIPTNLNEKYTVNENLDGTFYWENPYTGTEFFGYSDTVAPNPIPEPATMLLLGSGLIGLWGLRKKFKK